MNWALRVQVVVLLDRADTQAQTSTGQKCRTMGLGPLTGAYVQANLGELESAIGYSFTNPDLLVRALTHRSLANEQTSAGWGRGDSRDNERLEFLGDAVLGLAVGEAMFLKHPEWREGELTRVRAQLVSRQHMAEVAAALELGKHLRLSRGEDRSGLRRKNTVLSNTMEAVLGAMFLDGGLEPVRQFVRRHVTGRGSRATGEGTALRRGAGQLQIGASGASAGCAPGSAGVQS